MHIPYEDKEEIIKRKESFNQFGKKIQYYWIFMEQEILSCMIWKEHNN